MDIIENNERKQSIKLEISDLLDKNIPNILKKYKIPEDMINRIVKDLFIWANLTIDNDLN